MITLAQATEQVRRMKKLHRYPAAAKEAEAELIKIAATATDLAHCQRVVDSLLLDGDNECPTPYWFKRAISPPRPELYRLPERLTCPKEMCDGSGWTAEYWLHSQVGTGDARYVRKERITQEQHDELMRKIDWSTQSLYEGTKKCPCKGGVNRQTPKSANPIVFPGAANGN